MQVPSDRVELAEAAHGELERLDDREHRLMEAVEAGLWSLADVSSRLDAIHAERRQVEARTVVADVPQEVDWSWEPTALNEVLHALWETGPSTWPPARSRSRGATRHCADQTWLCQRPFPPSARPPLPKDPATGADQD